MLMSEAQAKKIAAQIIAMTKADDVIATVTSEKDMHLRFAANNVLTSGASEGRGASVTVWFDKKRGAASTSDLDNASLRAMVEEAEKIARNAPIDREYVPSLTKQIYKPVHAYFESTGDLSVTDRARQVGDIISECEKNGVIGAGFHSASVQVHAEATKRGNEEFDRSTLVQLSVTARMPDGQSSGYFVRNHNDISKLDTKRIAHEAIRKAVEGRGARAIDPGVYTVILEPQAVVDLLGFVGFAFGARNADEGRSAFSGPGGKTRVGEKIFDEKITLFSDPWYPDLPGEQAADGGIPAQRMVLINKGVLETLVYNRFWAKEKGVAPTPGPVNLIMQSSGPTSSVEEMIQSTERGILVSRLWYIRATDPRTLSYTGLTRDGVWLIEKGKIAYPLKNFRFNESVTRMLAPGNVLMLSKPERVNASMYPALKLKEFTFTSQSEAV